ncbi:hypothetical protein A0H81_11959 [Grifola frondosa]|uniref:Uncharacterized protein n=1 Tax=Grifola frondosa TaxID=5627 RepID=A0A1C7LVR9_GRIFR|nr:hypothetical protein A0H81_11959 [Grifola frondosa]
MSRTSNMVCFRQRLGSWRSHGRPTKCGRPWERATVNPHRDSKRANVNVTEEVPIEFRSSELTHNYYNLVDEGIEPIYGHVIPEGVYSGPNPLRKIAQGRPMYVSYVKPWGDDVSGNRSKQYNEHTNIYFAHANLPHDKLSQEYFFDTMMRDITSGTNTWHPAYDCVDQEDILFRILPNMFPVDNPQQSESCSHLGLHGNAWCRKCKLGGSQRDRETDEIFEQHFSPGDLRVARDTAQEVKKQIYAAALGVASTVEAMQTESGVKDKLAEFWIQQLIARARDLQQIRIHNPATRDSRLNARRIINRPLLCREICANIQSELMDWLYMQPTHHYNLLPPESPLRTQLRPGEHYNSLLELESGDIHCDTPVEILHTYLLGVDKYIWHHCSSAWSTRQCEKFALRLQSSSTIRKNPNAR